MEASATGSLITVNIDGKPLEKLIEVVSNGIGTLYRPRKIRKEADAEAYAIRILENAKAEASAGSMLVEADTIERLGKRLVAQEIRRQNNIDDVVETAAEDLKGKNVSDEHVDEDWATRFFGIVQDVSQEEMKVIWSKILAKEIERPSTFSMRTLETLRNLSTKEAELFVKIAPFVLRQNNHFIFNESSVLEECGIHYVDIAKLIECGLLQPGTFVQVSYESEQDRDSVNAIISCKYVVLMTLPRGTKKLDIPVTLLSQTGVELYSLIEPESNHNYIKSFAEYVKKKNTEVKMQYAEIISIKDGNIKYKTPAIDL